MVYGASFTYNSTVVRVGVCDTAGTSRQETQIAATALLSSAV